ncbi:MAG TPA: twin-arginine translocation signal domain-containing protein [Pseudomonadales bacterium]|nr:twin-arginine translocation signal domain-containing protein [Pseudomonadales bacterium]
MSLNRREFLQFGAVTGAAISTLSLTATLSGCSQPVSTSEGFQVLRKKDITIFGKVAAAALNLDDPEVIKKQMIAVDQFLWHTSLEGQKGLKKLLDLLDFAPSRFLVTGWTHSWEEASREQVSAVLAKWRSSSIDLLKISYTSLVAINSSVYYMQPENYAASGYPGPPQHDVSLAGAQ